MKIEYLAQGSPNSPLVRIFGTDRTEFFTLGEATRQLATNGRKSFEMQGLPGFVPVDGLAFTMVCSANNKGARQIAEKRFVWELTPAKWEIVAGLVEPFTRNPATGGYQWLSGGASAHGLGLGAIAVLLSKSEDGTW